jgi:hypothetical protein
MEQQMIQPHTFKTHEFAVIAASLMLTAPVQAADKCHDKAAMYQTSYSLHAAGLTDAQVEAQLVGFPFSAEERHEAAIRTKPDGDLGYMSAKTLYRHVYLACRGAA